MRTSRVLGCLGGRCLRRLTQIRVRWKDWKFLDWFVFFCTPKHVIDLCIILMALSTSICHTKRCNKIHSFKVLCLTGINKCPCKISVQTLVCVCFARFIYVSLHLLDGLLSETVVISAINVNIFTAVWPLFSLFGTIVNSIQLDKEKGRTGNRTWDCSVALLLFLYVALPLPLSPLVPSFSLIF